MGNRISYRDVLRHRANGLPDIDASPYGTLFELAVGMAHDYLGHGTFATVYDDEVTVLPIAHLEALADGNSGTYRMI